ncbi:MAG: carbohydrate ABC transporter permease [Anaerolineales bacterium]|nr:carbohydrate ABC transporter permease [Anaerolineales bacterium]
MTQLSRLNKFLSWVAVNIILMLLMAAFMIPFFYMTVGGFKLQNEIASSHVTIFPREPTLENYRVIFSEWPILRITGNSFLIALTVTASNLFFCSLAGLAYAKFRFPGRDKLFSLALLTMMIPMQAILVPLFIIMSGLNWVNTYQSIILPGAIGAFGIFFMRQYIDSSVPTELLDAARIDGCNEFGMYWLIVMPVIKPAMVTLGLILFMNAWNDYLWPMIMLNENAMYTLSLTVGAAGLRNYLLNWGEKLAAATLAAWPPVIIFFIFRKQFIESIMAGALKGG